ncbi:hypothetical protein DFO58_2163 [Arthrobacter sp. AG1021]|nr:hypothetical protein DFO58_2163 [Arthrobacter sp. AG1021]
MYEYRPTPVRIKYQDLADHMKDNPGVWVKVRTANTEAAAWAAAQQIKTGRRAAFRPAGDYDAYTQGCDIVARYTGGQES